MSHPLCSYIYELQVPGGAQASHALVLTEDDWNVSMADSVVVPIYRSPESKPSLVFVALDDELRANCTRVQSLPHEFLGKTVRICSGEPWIRTRVGVRRFLDIDRRFETRPAPAPAAPRTDWWPRQNGIHFANNTSIGPDDKLYGVISDDDWNSLPETTYAAAVRLTSKTKSQRRRWEVPVAGGWVVTGDLYSVSYGRFEHKPPPSRYPSRLSDEESSQVAAKQKIALTLS
ncbi:MAG: hypothetical protein H0T39_14985 [Actinobacteria bacterium]|nr:hypothetical protein [Actinomycetota bacterium]